MRLEIVTPDKNLFEGEASSVVCPGIEGSLGILNNHAPMIVALKEGQIKVKTEGSEELFDIKGGVVEVLKNKVIVLAE